MFCGTPYRLLVKSFHEAGEIASIAQRSIPRLTSGVDHLAVDVTSLASSAGRFTRDMVGKERDEEAVKIVMKAIQTNLIRRLKVKKSIAFFMDGTDPLWKVHHLRQFPGKVFDKAFYRSAASPMVYLLEDHILKLVGELRGTSSVMECVVSGPSTPGPAAMKITAWLLDLYARTLPSSVAASAAWSLLKGAAAGNSDDSANVPPSEVEEEKISGIPPTVTVDDSIILVGNAEDIHLNAWGVTSWTPTSLSAAASFCTVSFDQRDAYSLTLSDSLEWLEMGDLYQNAVTASTSSKAGIENGKKEVGESNKSLPSSPPLPTTSSAAKHALAAARTDAVFLYLLAFGAPAFGLPPLLGSVSFAQWMSAYTQETARQRQQWEKAFLKENGAVDEKGSSARTTPNSPLSSPSRASQRSGKGVGAPPPSSVPSVVLHPSTLGTLIHAYPSERFSFVLHEDTSSASTGDPSSTSKPEDGSHLVKKESQTVVKGDKKDEVHRTTPSPLRLNVEAIRRVLLGASQRQAMGSGKYHPIVDHYLEVALQTLHAYTFGFLPNPLYHPSDIKANFVEKGMRGVSVEQVISHLQYLTDRAPPYTSSGEKLAPSVPAPASVSTRGSASPVSSSPSAAAAPLSYHRVSVVSPVSSSSSSSSSSSPSSPSSLPFVELFSQCASLSAGELPAALTGAQQLCLSSTKPEYMRQVLPVMTRGHVPTAAQISKITEAKAAADALLHVQELIPPQHDPFLVSSSDKEAEKKPNEQKETDERHSWIDGALRFYPSYYVCRSGAGAISPWEYHSVDLGVKSEALNVRSMVL